eukprot:TRINITY_DN1750_c0_g1_i3.p1 TRINITY_DN1750_c0_g1~~TRINITY_DN1750_c0_g1_i3.p1  ORF type:complete len:781 (+),score=77.82 TRINITY_DN1750_c0_g1_i3:242-2584(+)
MIEKKREEHAMKMQKRKKRNDELRTLTRARLKKLAKTDGFDVRGGYERKAELIEAILAQEEITMDDPDPTELVKDERDPIPLRQVKSEDEILAKLAALETIPVDLPSKEQREGLWELLNTLKSQNKKIQDSSDALLGEYKKPSNERHIRQYPSFAGDYVGREELAQQWTTMVRNLWTAFVTQSDARWNHFFPTLFTGSGMGKTRFGAQALEIAIKTLRAEKTSEETPLLTALTSPFVVHLFINFNGGKPSPGVKEESDATTIYGSDRLLYGETNGAAALAFRLACRGLLGCAVSEVATTITYPLNLTVASVLQEIASVLRNSHKDQSATVVFYLHIDEVQLVYKESNERFVKDMINALGDLRLCMDPFNVFILPLLSGTTDSGSEFELTRYLSKQLALSPLSPPAAEELVVKGCQGLCDDRYWTHFLKSKVVKQLIGTLGGNPRLLRRLVGKVHEFYPIIQDGIRSDEQHVNWVTCLATSFSQNLDFDTFFVNGINLLKQEPRWCFVRNITNLLHYFVDGIDVTWTTQIGPCTIRELAHAGFMYLRKYNGSSFQIYLPQVLLSRFCSILLKQYQGLLYRYDKYTVELLLGLTAYPPSQWTNSGANFERTALGLLVIRLRNLARLNALPRPSRKPSYCTLHELFPGAALSSTLKDKQLRLPTSIKLATACRQFIAKGCGYKEGQRLPKYVGVIHAGKKSKKGSQKMRTVYGYDAVEVIDSVSKHRHWVRLSDRSRALFTAPGTFLVDAVVAFDTVILMLQFKVSNDETQRDTEVSTWFEEL